MKSCMPAMRQRVRRLRDRYVRLAVRAPRSPHGVLDDVDVLRHIPDVFCRGRSERLAVDFTWPDWGASSPVMMSAAWTCRTRSSDQCHRRVLRDIERHVSSACAAASGYA